MFLQKSAFICPICRAPLFKTESIFRCLSGHCFDIHKSGYVNLLIKNSQGKRHGDDVDMVRSRTAFLEKGYYSPLRDCLCEILGKGHIVLDSGCGEGYYTEAFSQHNTLCGIDISKDALRFAAKRLKGVDLAVASVGDIPLRDNLVDTVICIFAPESQEFSRILPKGGRLITVTPMENHLIELKAAVYNEPYLNPPVNTEKQGFILKSSKELKYNINLDCNEDIVALFKMTPYYYKTSKEDQKKLQNLERLSTTVEFFIAEYEIQ